MLEDDNLKLHDDLFNTEDDGTSNNLPPKKSLARSNSNVIIAGVCAGFGETYNFDISTIRLAAMLTLFFGGWSIAAYLIMAFLLPVRFSLLELGWEEKDNLRKENFNTVLSGALIIMGIHFALVEIGLENYSALFLLPVETMLPLLLIGTGIFILRARNASEQIIYPELKFYRSRNKRLMLGVCGGFAEYLDVDVVSLRIILILLTGLTLGFLAIVYLMIGYLAPISLIKSEMENE